MQKLSRRRSEKTGLPPGTPVHIGEHKAAETKITLIEYDQSQLREETLKADELCVSLEGKTAVTWINVDGVHDAETLRKIGECFGLHPLVVEDVMNTNQRPKIEDYDDKLYIVLRTFCCDEATRQAAPEQVSLVLGANFVLSFQEKESHLFDSVRDHIRQSKGRIRHFGADYLAYALLDVVVDSYFGTLEHIEDRIEVLESELMAQPTPQTVQKIHHTKSDILTVRKALWPLRELTSRLAVGESKLIKDTTEVYVRDVHDHTIQLVDTMESFRDILAGMLDIYLTGMSNRMNAVMKVLTLIATIFMPLTLIVGIYGMNFRYMPELTYRWGYFAVWAAMIVIAAAMLLWFRRKRWL